MACVAIGCKSRMGASSERNQRFSFHRFPKSPVLKNKWIKNMKRDNWTPSPYSRLCSLHFNESCYREGYQTKILHSDAVPTIFTHVPSDLHKISVRRDRPSRLELCAQSTSKTNNIQEEILDLRSTISEQNKLINKLRKIAERYKIIAERRQRALKMIRQRYSRQNQKLTYYDTIINEILKT